MRTLVWIRCISAIRDPKALQASAPEFIASRQPLPDDAALVSPFRRDPPEEVMKRSHHVVADNCVESPDFLGRKSRESNPDTYLPLGSVMKSINHVVAIIGEGLEIARPLMPLNTLKPLMNKNFFVAAAGRCWWSGA